MYVCIMLAETTLVHLPQDSVAAIRGIHIYRHFCIIEKYDLGQGWQIRLQSLRGFWEISFLSMATDSDSSYLWGSYRDDLGGMIEIDCAFVGLSCLFSSEMSDWRQCFFFKVWRAEALQCWQCTVLACALQQDWVAWCTTGRLFKLELVPQHPL